MPHGFLRQLEVRIGNITQREKLLLAEEAVTAGDRERDYDAISFLQFRN